MIRNDRSVSHDGIGNVADAAGAFHLFFGERGRVVDSGETEAKFVGICRTAKSLVEID